MTTEFKLPLISEGVESADVAAVHVHEGDMIQAGQIVLEVETEKAVAEIPSPQAGRVTKVLVKQGETVKIGQPLLTIDESAAGSGGGAGGGAAAPAKSAAPAAAKAEPAKAQPAKASPAPSAPAPSTPKPSTPAPAAPAQKQPASTPARPAPPQPVTAPPTVAAASEPAAPDRGEVSGNGQDSGAPVPAGPATRRLARELGVD